MNKIKIMVDAGHGGKDSGAVGVKGLREADVNLQIAKAVKKLLDSRMTVILTRTRNNYIDINSRWKKANELGVQAFISIHQNAGDSTAQGLETWIKINPLKDSKKLADCIQSETARVSNSLDRGVKQHNWGVVTYTHMPSCLHECEFISNKEAEARMKTKSWIQEQALAIANGIIKYFDLT